MPGWLWPVLAAPFAGSLAGVLVRRLPAGKPVALARSACEACGRPLRPWDLVPIVSFLALRGRCGGCGAAIAREHIAIELAAIVIPASAALAGLDAEWLWAASVFGWALLTLAWIDAKHWILPDVLTLPLLLAGLMLTAGLEPEALTGHALAAAIAYSALRAVEIGYRRLRGRDGLGEGDAKLLAAIGAWVGLEGLAPALLAGSVCGLAIALPAAIRQRGQGPLGAVAIPFGPALAIGGWMALLLGWS